MGKGMSKVVIGCILALLMASSCAAPGGEVNESSGLVVTPENDLKKVSRWNTPEFTDDLPLAGIYESVRGSIEYYSRQSPERTYRFGKEIFTASELKTSLEEFLGLMEGTQDEKERRNLLRKMFTVYRGGGKGNKVIFTGYYEPVLYGSRLPGIDYTVPLFGIPNDLIKVDLARFLSDLKGRRLTGRYQNGTLVPYYSRYEIDRLGILSGRGYELAWVQDPVDAYFLQIQGSGRIILPDGNILYVHYAGNNGLPYRSIGKRLMEIGKIPDEEMSMRTLKEYLAKHPEEMERTLDYNERYIFFEDVPLGPLGSTGVLLTPERSMATDPGFYPPGALAYVETEVPILGEDGKPREWKKIRRFVLNQDAGGAIRGPERADLFFGTGDKAGQIAGWMKQAGRLYFLAPKRAN